MTRRSTKLIREADYAAEVPVELSDEPGEWGPYLSAHDARKLDEVREALRRGDISQAQRLARVYRLLPVQARA